MTDQRPPGAAELAEKLAAESAELARTHQRLEEVAPPGQPAQEGGDR